MPASNSKLTTASILEDDFERVSDWLRANKLSLHVGKTVCMHIISKQRANHMINTDLEIQLHDTRIQQVNACPYLGVTLDSNLNFEHQC